LNTFRISLATLGFFCHNLNVFKTESIKGEATRQQILKTALALFRSQGFDSTTMRDIAAAAGMSLGAAYYYFETKEAIVAAYYEYVQAEHAARAREQFQKQSKLRPRLAAAIHTKLDILQDDRQLMGALFRYGGDPDHPLSWFGPGTRPERDLSMAIFADAIANERLPNDVRDVAPVLLWTLHMGIVLYFLYDKSPNQKRTRRLVEAAVNLVIQAKRIVTLPLMRPVRKRVIDALREAELIPIVPASLTQLAQEISGRS
jgi:AcrR family transcriptional regulator